MFDAHAQALENKMALILGGLVIILLPVFLTSRALGRYFEKRHLSSQA